MKHFFDNYDEQYISLLAMRRTIPDLYKTYKRMNAGMRADFVKTNEFMSFFEHKSACSGCSSVCCAKGPCGYSANDFDFFEKYAFEKLSECINNSRAAINVHVGGGLWTDKPNPAYSLTARTKKGSIINFTSPKGECEHLTPSGCAHTIDFRPTMAVLFVNNQKRGCRNIMDTHHDTRQWLHPQRQEVLHKLAKHFYDSNEPFKKNFEKTVDQERDMSLGIY